MQLHGDLAKVHQRQDTAVQTTTRENIVNNLVDLLELFSTQVQTTPQHVSTAQGIHKMQGFELWILDEEAIPDNTKTLEFA